MPKEPKQTQLIPDSARGPIETGTFEINEPRTQEERDLLAEARSNNVSVQRAVATVIATYNDKLQQIEDTKEAKYKLYRQISQYPEAADAIDEACDEGINHHALSGNVCELRVSGDHSNTQVKELRAQFDYVAFDLMNLNRDAWDHFREFLVFAEQFYVMAWPQEEPEQGLTAVESLPVSTTHAVFENGTGDVQEFIQKDATGDKINVFDKDRVAYTNSGDYQVLDVVKTRRAFRHIWPAAASADLETGETGQVKLFVSYLDRAKRPFFQLKQIEDAVVIYRLARAPERFKFIINVGDMQPQQAEAYVQQLMQRYKRDLTYDPTTGEVTDYADIMSMLETFWLPQMGDGRGTDVQSISGGQNLGELEDVRYFQRKLYRALKIPVSRLEEKYSYHSGTMNDVTRQEVKFSRFVKRQVTKYARAVEDVYWTHLQLLGLDEQYGLTRSDVHIHFYPSNLFEQYREMELQEAQLRVLGNIDRQIGEYIAPSVAFTKYGGFTEQEWEENLQKLAQWKEAQEDNGAPRRF